MTRAYLTLAFWVLLAAVGVEMGFAFVLLSDGEAQEAVAAGWLIAGCALAVGGLDALYGLIPHA